VRVEDASSAACDALRTGAPIDIVVEWDALDIKPHEAQNVFVNVIFLNEKKQRLFGTPSDIVGAAISMENGSGRYRCRIPKLPLLPGVYTCVIGIQIDGQLVDKVDDAMTIMVLEGDYHGTGRLPVRQFGDIITDYAWTREAPQSIGVVGR
jgi:lipopolysaccharide transport system ATP-binding protein